MAETEPFGSAFSIGDFAFAERARLQPISMVMGCDVRWISQALPEPPEIALFDHVDLAALSATPAPELAEQVAQARDRALKRLRAQAAAAGANLVIGIHQRPGVIAWSPKRRHHADPVQYARGRTQMFVTRLLEYQLIGTAVRDGADETAEPRLCTLDAADLWKLQGGGWRPAGIVTGCAYQFHGSVGYGSGNGEVHEATAVWATVREAALETVRAEAAALGADGVVGIEMQVEHRDVDWKWGGREPTGLLVGVSIIATAIHRTAAPARRPAAPLRIMSLS